MAFPALRLKRPVPQRATNDAVHLPAPVGGINASDPASAMPPTDCLSLWNFIPYQYGLRVRSGWREWCSNVGTSQAGLGFFDDGSPLEFSIAAPLGGAVVGNWPGITRDGVRTLIAFYGKNEAGNRLFACTAGGIWDCTHSTDAPVMVYDFAANGLVSNGESGKGIYTSFANAASNHYIAYCDAANGYLLYSESSGTWSKVGYSAVAGNINPTLGNGDPAPNPSSFRFVMSWKNRLWFIPEDSSTAYYLNVSEFYGTLNPIYFGSRFSHGGSLVGLWSWTIDGGSGIDDKLVGISSGGDVVIYEGTDPTDPTAFGLKGVWWVGQVPPGRNIASDFGGDLFILSRLGCVPLSKLVSGVLVAEPTLYATTKIANLFNSLMTERGMFEGWSVKMHPSDNILIVNVPASPDKPQQQLVMSLANKGWAQHYGVPMMCMEAWKGTLYFGTEDSQVCVNDGYTDGAKLDGTQGYAIDCVIETAYNNMGTARKKRVHMIRPYFSTDGTKPGYQVQARYDFDLAGIGIVPTTPTPPASSWGLGKWGAALWGKGTGTEARLKGTTGMGTSVAFILRMTTKTNTTLVGFDAIMDQGGLR